MHTSCSQPVVRGPPNHFNLPVSNKKLHFPPYVPRHILIIAYPYFLVPLIIAFSSHIYMVFLFLYVVSTLTFCINVSYESVHKVRHARERVSPRRWDSL